VVFDLFAAVLSHKEREKEIIVLEETCKSYFGIFSKSLKRHVFQGFEPAKKGVECA
jgi:hypothetical protein